MVLNHFQVQLRKCACTRIGAEWRMFGGAVVLSQVASRYKLAPLAPAVSRR